MQTKSGSENQTRHTRYLVEVSEVEGVEVGVLVGADEVHWLLRVPRHRI